MFIVTQGRSGSVIFNVTDTRVSSQNLAVTIEGYCGNDLTVTRLLRTGALMCDQICRYSSLDAEPLPGVSSAY